MQTNGGQRPTDQWKECTDEWWSENEHTDGFGDNHLSRCLSKILKRSERESNGKSGCVAFLQDSELAECIFHGAELSECFLEHRRPSALPIFDTC